MPTRRNRSARCLGAAALAVLSLAASPAAASASCPDVPSSQALLAFGDSNDYFLAPGGSFEGYNSWERSGFVHREDALKPFSLAGPNALEIAPGAAATSPELCMSEIHSHLRYFARSASAAGSMRVDAIEDGIATPLGVVDGTRHGSWALSAPVPLAPALDIAPDASRTVRLRFTAVEGEWKIDGVYVDPYRR